MLPLGAGERWHRSPVNPVNSNNNINNTKPKKKKKKLMNSRKKKKKKKKKEKQQQVDDVTFFYGALTPVAPLGFLFLDLIETLGDFLTHAKHELC